MACEAAHKVESAGRPGPQVPSIVMVSEPGGVSLLRALGLIAVSGLSLHSLDLRHDGPEGEAVSRIWLSQAKGDPRIGAVCLKISQLPTVTSAEVPADPFSRKQTS